MRTSTRRLRAAAVASALAAMTAIGQVPAEATPIANGDFYTNVPADLSSYAPGDLIAWQSETDLLPALDDLTAYRVMFRSDGWDGSAVAETGMVFVPNGTPPEGGWPVVAWGHGTSGVGDACAPSKYPSLYADPWPQYGREIARLVHDGYVVAAPDYEGMGPPGLHSYLNTDAEAVAMIDSVRAAHHVAEDVADTSVSQEWAAIGHSQGGQAAIGAAELAPVRAPELQLVGTVGLAPAAMLEKGLEAVAANKYYFPYIGYMAAGIGATHPGFDYSKFVGPELLPYMAYAQEWCFDEWFPQIIRHLKPGVNRVLARGWASNPDVRDYFADSEIGTRPIEAPVLYLQGTLDLLYLVSNRQVQRMCDLGDVVKYSLYPGLAHDPVVWKGWTETSRWLAARFAGKPAPNDC
jgi:pimeloyl-ACP methyl ester carboxylesterase